MTPKEQLAAIEQAAKLICNVEQARRASDDDADKTIARQCYLARETLALVESECLIELGIRERKSYNSLCPWRDRKETTTT